MSMLFALAACATAPSPRSFSSTTAPQVIIQSPPNGTQYYPGAQVTVQSIASDAVGVVRAQLWVDGQSVRNDTAVPGANSSQWRVEQLWTSTTIGSHTLTVRATNQAGKTGEASISIDVIDLPTTPTAAPVIPSPVPTQPRSPATQVEPPTQSPVIPTLMPTAVSAPASRSITASEAEINALLSDMLAQSQQDQISSLSARLQNGQILTNVGIKIFGGLTVSGQVAFAVSASNCDVQVSVVQSSLPAPLTEEQKAGFSAQVKQAIKSELAKKANYSCIESVQIGNGTLTIQYH